MLRLYNKLSDYGVVMSMMADNDVQLVHIRFEKAGIRRWYGYTYETVCDPVRWEGMLLQHLGEFMFIYEQKCIKRRRAMGLRDHLWKEK